MRWAAYALVAATQLITLALGMRAVSVPAQALLMPALILVALSARPGRLRTWTVVALVFSFLGDLLPQLVAESLRMPLLMGPFLLAHVAWVIGFWTVRRESAWARGQWRLLPYLAAAIGVVAWCLPGAGVLAPALVVYALALLATSTLATGLGWPGWLGGALFVVSDALIAAKSFAGASFPLQDVAVMATYIAAHGLFVHGVIRRSERAGAATIR